MQRAQLISQALSLNNTQVFYYNYYLLGFHLLASIMLILIHHYQYHHQECDNLVDMWSRVTWGKAPPRGKAPLPSNYKFTYASGSISWLTMHHVGKVFMSQTNLSWIAIWENSACLNFLRLFL